MSGIPRRRASRLAAPVGDQSAQVKDVARGTSGKRLRPRDNGLGRLGPAVVEEDAPELERETCTERLGCAPRGMRLRTREPQARLVAFAAEERAASRGEEQRHAFRRGGDPRKRGT